MITLLHGNDEFLIDQEFRKIVKPYNDPDVVIFNDQMDYTVQDIIDECNMLDLFMSNKIVKVIEPAFLKSKEITNEKNKVLIDYLIHANPDCELVFISSFDIDKRSKFSKEFFKYVKTIECNHPDDIGKRQLVISMIKAKKINIERNDIDVLCELLPNDVSIINSELDKLALYPDVIDKTLLNKMISRPLDDDVFHLSNALVEHNTARTLSKWKDLKALNHDPINILLILASQIRFMFEVKVYLEKGNTDAQIASLLKANPYRVSLVHKKVNGVSSNLILKTLGDLAVLDQSMKKGLIEPNLGLEQFIIRYTR